MGLKNYFASLIKKVEDSDLVTNAGKDKNGFFLPTKIVLIRHLKLLEDLHGKPLAKDMVRDSWKFVVEHLPPEWLVLTDAEKAELKEILKK